MTAIEPTRVIGPGRTPVSRAPAVVAPRVRVASVGDIAGLSPKRHRSDGGEVPIADVDTIDALDRTVEWPTVAAWLKEQRKATTRRTYLAVAAVFVRWLEANEPGTRILGGDRDLFTHYRDELDSGGATGRPLKPRTINRHLAGLSSLYDYAIERDVLAANPVRSPRRPKVGTTGETPAMSRADGAALLRGAAAIADERPLDAAAVVILMVCLLRASELTGLTVGDVREDAGHTVLMVDGKGGGRERVPVPKSVAALLDPLREGRSAHEPLLRNPDGSPWSRWRPYTSLRRAAIAGGVPPERAKKYRTHRTRAAGATILLGRDVSVRKVQKALRHRHSSTTELYDRGDDVLADHAVHDLARYYEEEEDTL